MTDTKPTSFSAKVEDAITKAAAALDKVTSPEARAILLSQLSSLHAAAGRPMPIESTSCTAITPSADLRQLLAAVVADITAGRYKYPAQIVDISDPDGYIALMVAHAFKHLVESGQERLTRLFSSNRRLKKALVDAGLVIVKDISFVLDNGTRQTHAIALSAQRLREIGAL